MRGSRESTSGKEISSMQTLVLGFVMSLHLKLLLTSFSISRALLVRKSAAVILKAVCTRDLDEVRSCHCLIVFFHPAFVLESFTIVRD